MKNIKIISFILLTAMFLTLLAGCSGEEKKEVTVEVTVTYQDEEGDEVKISDTVTFSSEKPTGILALEQLCNQNEITFDVDEYGSLSTFDGIANGEDDEWRYFWVFKQNGSEPKDGNASSKEISDGDKVEFVYDKTELKPNDWVDPDAK